MIKIRRAVVEDIPAIMKFIEQYWKKDHILATDRKFFDWMYLDRGKVNFNIAVEEATGELFGVNGFILYNSEDTPDVSGALWKARPTEQNPVLGLDLGNYLRELVHYRHNISVGISKRARKLEILRGREVVELKRYYMLNELPEYHIARVKYKPQCSPKMVQSSFVRIENIEDFRQWISEEELKRNTPYKEYRYIRHRYFEHPVYQYCFLGLCVDGDRRKGVFVGRRVEYKGSVAFKIVDYFGRDEEIADSCLAFQDILRTEGFEYIDFYEYGIPEQYMVDAGFTLLQGEDNIIPNYFEPFEQKNVEISAVPCEGPHLHIYRGDADQDRPGFSRERG